MRWLVLGLSVLALSTICALGANADDKNRRWKAIPGHPTIFVDMSSIQPVNAEEVCHNPPFIPLDTIVEIRRDGNRETLWLNCKPPRCVRVQASKLEQSVMPVVCPARPR